MIDSENLRTASLYINNQLLSRGLLRDGRSIDFDSPSDDHDELADTMGRIMAVVNDLILRRDVRPLLLSTRACCLLHLADLHLPARRRAPRIPLHQPAHPPRRLHAPVR